MMRTSFLLALAGLILGGCSRPATTAADAPETNPAPASSAGVPSASAPTRTISFKFPTQTLTVPEGFTVELVAGPPLVNRPISVAFDEQGRLYVTDSSGLSDRANIQWEQKPHRVVRLEDADGDGRFERSSVFAERMMFPQGALFYEGSLYVGAPPQVVKLTDKNDDGISDERTIWYDGKTLTHCGNDLHGPYLGLDGRIYWTKGSYAEQQHTLANGKKIVTSAGHIFRSRPNGADREIVLTGGMANPVGVTFTVTGERILSGTFFERGPGKRDGLIHAIYGGVYGQDRDTLAGHPRTGDLMPVMTHMDAAAPAGSTTYRSNVFGRDYTGNLFVCYFNLRKVSRHQIVPDGAGLRTIDTDFVTSDSHDFHPTDVLEDADGSLLVIDTGGWYKICCQTSQMAKPDVLGGIYRIRKTGASVRSDARGTTIAWSQLSPAELVRLLGDGRPYVVDRAIHRLGQLGAAALPALEASGLNATSPSARRNALWALARIESDSARAATRRLLNDPDSSVVHVALQVVSLWRDRAALDRLQQLVAGDNATLARLAAEALGRIGDARAVDALLAATKRLRGNTFTQAGAPAEPGERLLEHALIYALMEIGERDAVYARLTSSKDARLRRVALVALDQMPGGALQPADVIDWLDADDRVLKQTARWVVGNHADWGDALSAYFHKRLDASTASAADLEDVQALLATLSGSVSIQELLATIASKTSEPAETRLVALRAMAATRMKELPAPWQDVLTEMLADPSIDPEVARQAVITARSLSGSAKAKGRVKLAHALAQIGRTSGLPADVRLDALALAATTPGVLATIEPPLFDFLLGHLDPAQPLPMRSAAATVLGNAPLTSEQQLALADAIKTVGPLEISKILPAFERKPTEALGLRVIASLRQSTGIAGVRVNNLKSLFAKYSPNVQLEGEKILALVNADAARQNARVDELLTGIAGGDVRRGQAVFHSAKASCSLCHTVGWLGGRLGPDLTGIGKIRNERELLEAVIFPSATFVRGYEPVTVTTKSGAEHTGILKEDTSEEVVLATGPDSEQRVARLQVRDVQPASLSPMPPGMDAILTPQELADLIVYLKARER